MANWDFVFPYTQEAADWLKDQGCVFQQVREGNRLPTTGDMKLVLAAQGNLVLDYPAPGDNQDFYVFEQGQTGFSVVIGGFDWSNDEFAPQECFKIRWMCELQAAILDGLCQSCGQLIMWPDTGCPAVIFPLGMDATQLVELHHAATDWPDFFRALYGES